MVVDIDKARLIDRMKRYFDPGVGDSEIRAIMPTAMTSTARFDAKKTRRYLVQRGFKPEYIVRYCYRPFDNRWLYWEPETKLLDEKRTEYWEHLIKGNLFIEAREKEPKDDFNRGTTVSGLADNFGNGLSTFFPRALNEGSGSHVRSNLTKQLLEYVAKIDLKPEAIFSHVISILHAPSYRSENLGALRMDWPRVPIPAQIPLKHSAALGETLAMFLDPGALANGLATRPSKTLQH